MILRVSRIAAVAAAALLIMSCEKPREVVVTETRPVTTSDGSLKLFATSDQRFRDSKPSPVRGEAPANWLVQPPREFRVLNYRFGESGTGEAWVTIASGGVLENVNRWLKQFSQAPLDEAGFKQLRTIPIAGGEGVWVEATGKYAGMGTEAKSDYALAGVVALIGERLLTVKMVGLESEVAAAKPDLEAFAKSIKFVD